MEESFLSNHGFNTLAHLFEAWDKVDDHGVRGMMGQNCLSDGIQEEEKNKEPEMRCIFLGHCPQ